MTWNHDLHAQLLTRLGEMVGATCIVKLKGNAGHRRGVIVGVSSVVLGTDLQESISLTQFNVEFGRADESSVVSGSMLSDLRLPDETKLA